MPLLLKFNSNYADEFDVDGFVALSEQEWEEYKTKIREIVGKIGFDYYFGTNENLDFGGAESYLKCFKETKISQEEYDFLLKNFGSLQFGGWNGKDHTIKQTIVKYGMVPYYFGDTFEYLKESIKDRIEDDKLWHLGLEEGMAGVPSSSTNDSHMSGYREGCYRKQYGSKKWE